MILRKRPNPISPFGTGILKGSASRPPDGDYAMWWPSTDDPDAATSRCVAYIGRSVRALDRIESYVLGALRFQLGLQPSAERRPIPEAGVTYHVIGAEGQSMLISADPEKGFGLFFRPEVTPVPYRDDLWRKFAEYAEASRTAIETHRMPTDPLPRGHSTAMGHWDGVMRSLAMHGREVTALGTIRLP